jgi:hypothetical protein
VGGGVRKRAAREDREAEREAEKEAEKEKEIISRATSTASKLFGDRAH